VNQPATGFQTLSPAAIEAARATVHRVNFLLRRVSRAHPSIEFLPEFDQLDEIEESFDDFIAYAQDVAANLPEPFPAQLSDILAEGAALVAMAQDPALPL
jgi:hypothetical protein